MTIQKAKEDPLKAYVLTDDKNIPTSGVRIGALDLGYEDLQSLKNSQLDQTLLDKLTPFLGLSGKQAEDALEKSPLVLTNEQLEKINTIGFIFWDDLLNKYTKEANIIFYRNLIFNNVLKLFLI